MRARQQDAHKEIQSHQLDPLDIPSNICNNFGAASWVAERKSTGMWECCSDGKVDFLPPDSVLLEDAYLITMKNFMKNVLNDCIH